MDLFSRFFAAIVLVIFSFSIQSVAQNSVTLQVEDYVILKNGRRFDGTVMRTLGQVDFDQIEFLRRGETEIYTAEDILSFGLGTGEFFKSVGLPDLTDKRFIQVFYEGELLLGKTQGVFYAGLEEELKPLTAKDYKLTLRELMKGDCQKRVSSLVRSSKLNEEDLIWLFGKYYGCKGGDFIFYGKVRPPFILSPIVRIGVFETGIKTHIRGRDRKDLLISTPVIQGYAAMSIHSLRQHPRFSADIGLAFETSQLTWETQYIGASIRVTGTEEINHSFISIPFSINYSLIKTRKTDFFIGIGGGYGLSSSNSGFAIQEERVTFSNQVSLDEGSFTKIRSGGFFYHGQAGLLFNLPSDRAITISAILRRVGDYYSSKAGSNVANYDKLDFGFGLGFRF